MPALALGGSSARVRRAHDLDVVCAQVSDSRLHVVDVDREVVASDVAVARLGRLAIGRVVEKGLDVAAISQPVETDLFDHGARVHPEGHSHPVVVGALGSERVDVLGAENVDEEAFGLVEVGHGDADVVDASHAG